MNQKNRHIKHVATVGFSDNRFIKKNKKNRKKIMKLQDEMAKMDQALDQFSLTHYFAPGVYAREIFCPAGSTFVGKIHKYAHLNFIQKGVIVITTEEGTKELKAPCIFTSLAGTKRAAHVKEDTIWVTVHVTDKTNLDEIEDEIIAKDFDEIECEELMNKVKSKS